MKLLHSAALILALVAVTGCSSVEVDARQAALNQARELWKAEGPEEYRFTWRFSIMTRQTRVVVTVRDGHTMRADPMGVPPQNGLLLTRSGRSGTVEDVFKILESALAEADAVEVSYNSELGYPESVFVDYELNMADEERRFGILKLQEL